MIIIFLILGLIIGSFLNAVVYRLNAVESLMERSHCPHCKKQVRWYDNVPVLSFIILSSRCRDCGEKISWQYPIVEVVTGIMFAIIGSYFFNLFDISSWALTAYYLAVFSLLMVIFIYDFKFMEIPMIIVWMAVALSVVFFLWTDWQNFNPALGLMDLKIFSGAIGAVVAFMFFFILASVSKETWMGYGDAYVGLLIGLMAGWPLIFPTLLVSFTVGALVSVVLVMFGKKGMKSQVPFAPFLAIGIFAVIVLPKIFPTLSYWLDIYKI